MSRSRSAAPVPLTVETSHAVARVEDDPSRPSGRILYLDGIECSYVDLDDPTHLEFGYVRRIGDVIDLAAPPGQALRVTHLGGGGCTLPGYVAATRPGSRQIVYEYDAELLALVRRELGLRTGPGLRVKVGDARARIGNRTPGTADVIVGDAFVGRHVPPHLTTSEFVGEVRRLLADDGIYVLNVIDAPPLAAARAQAAALLTAFSDVVLITDADVLRGKESGNVILAASDRSLPAAELRRRASHGALPDRVLERADVTRFAGSAVPGRDP